jgi:hypothetical protein
MSNETKIPVCYLSVTGRNNDGTLWTQETYETAANDARTRATQLRKLGFDVHCVSLGTQVTRLGLIKLTLVNVHSHPYDKMVPKPVKMMSDV